MALLIDGYNLLHATGIFAAPGAGTELHRTRLALLDFLSAALSKRERTTTTIVFDAAGAPPGLPASTNHDGIMVRFARGQSDADEMIEDLLEAWVAPRSLVVVSSDHRVQRAARRRGATFVDSESWYSERRVAMRQKRRKIAEGGSKPTGDLSPGDLAYWMQEFGEAPLVDESNNPFPPGYGDDLDEETA